MSDEPVKEVVLPDVEKLSTIIPSVNEELTVPDETLTELLAVATVGDVTDNVSATIPTNNPIDLEVLGIITADDGGVADVIDAFDKAVIINSEERKGQNSFDELQKIQSVQSHLSAGTQDFPRLLSYFFKDSYLTALLPIIRSPHIFSRNLIL